jgi:D-alanyl-D-alanine carboxypeptidase/D-alanyl-D-alanine-endopeptidase (penicillin-binding protein 4)
VAARPGSLAVLGAAVVLPAAALAWFASSQADDAASGEPAAAVAEPAPGPSVATPLLSSRRVPGVVTGQLASGPMVAALEPMRAQVNDESCLVVEVSGRPVFDEDGGRAPIPGSNQKLLVAAVALERLGDDHRFTTEVRGAAPIDGVVDGDLVLVGGGDPLLSTQTYLAEAARQLRYVPTPATSMEALADAVVASGVRRVTGTVVGDESRYDTERGSDGWGSDLFANFEVSYLGALMVDDGFEAVRPLRLSREPATHAAAVLARLLSERGVVVGGAPAGTPAAPVTLGSVSSAPLREVVGEMLRESDNVTAELLLKEIGHAATGGPGSRLGGLAAVTETLQGWGIPLDGAAFFDGSGLDRRNRVSCRTFATLLDRYPPGTPLADGLAVAGRTGTLTQRFQGNPVEGRLLAKTGTLSRVKALSGLLPTEGEPPVTFSLLLNGANAAGDSFGLWDALGRALGQYPYRPDLSAYGPRPPQPGA